MCKSLIFRVFIQPSSDTVTDCDVILSLLLIYVYEKAFGVHNTGFQY